jgi:hypothetical protein
MPVFAAAFCISSPNATAACAAEYICVATPAMDVAMPSAPKTLLAVAPNSFRPSSNP